MGITTQKLALCAAFGIAGLLCASCNSTSTPAEEPASTEEATSSTLSLPASEAPEEEAVSPSTDDPYSDRAVPFSEERVDELEGALKPLDNVPVPDEALPPPKDKGDPQHS